MSPGSWCCGTEVRPRHGFPRSCQQKSERLRCVGVPGAGQGQPLKRLWMSRKLAHRLTSSFRSVVHPRLGHWRRNLYTLFFSRSRAGGELNFQSNVCYDDFCRKRANVKVSREKMLWWPHLSLVMTEASGSQGNLVSRPPVGNVTLQRNRRGPGICCLSQPANKQRKSIVVTHSWKKLHEKRTTEDAKAETWDTACIKAKFHPLFLYKKSLEKIPSWTVWYWDPGNRMPKPDGIITLCISVELYSIYAYPFGLGHF